MRRRLGFGLLVLAASASAGAFAIAQTGGPGSSNKQKGEPGSSPAVPEHGVSGVGVPKGPFIDFCPTQRQSELHIKLYGGDLKPTVGCNGARELPPPTAEQIAKFPDPDEGLSAEEECARDQKLYRSATPLPDSDNDPTSIEGLLPSGNVVRITIFTDDPDSLRGRTIHDEARDLC